jgi:hypothetical protein
MLSAAADRLQFLEQSCPKGTLNDCSLLGVEVDVSQAEEAASLCSRNHILNTFGKVWQAEAFTELSGLLTRKDSLTFDAVVGNPPYVRYQNMAFLLDEICPSLVSAFESQMKNANKSEVAQTIVRTGLLNAALKINAGTLDELASEALRLLNRPEQAADRVDSPLAASWVRLVSEYSGLSDLSLPSWLLSWCLASPGGYISFVSTTAWKNREYGRPLRYFMHRMLRPIAQIDQEQRSWFPNADVDASLYIFQKRHLDEAGTPLTDRSDDSCYPHLRVLHPHDLSNEPTLRNLSEAMSGQGSNSLVEAADQIVKYLRNSESNVEQPGFQIRQISEKEKVEDLLSGEQDGGLLWKLEGKKPSVWSGPGNGSRIRIPSQLRRDLHLPVGTNQSVQDLDSYGVSVNQGLRTGCNAFFYLRIPTQDELKTLFPERKAEEVREILANASSDPSEARTIADCLKDKGGLCPSESPEKWPSMQLVFADEELGGFPCILPSSVLIPAYRYQRELDGLAVHSKPRYWTFVVRSAARPQDLRSVKEHYDSSLIEDWESEYGFRELSSTPTKLINLGEKTVLSRGGRDVRIPNMSAVSPNARTPSGEMDLFEDVPPPPAWWYNLRIKPRHWGPLFMPRVNSMHPTAHVAQHEGQETLIDANFSTFSPENHISVSTLFALLNSSWVRLALEYTSTTMGGGALKVEASHLRRLPLPSLSANSLSKLHKIGEAIQTGNEGNEEDLLAEIDWVVVENLTSSQCSDYSSRLFERMRQISDNRVQARNR